METGYQRGRIQDESMLYEHKKHDGSLPIVGVNTFLADTSETAGSAGTPATLELARGTEEEKTSQLRRLDDFHSRHREEAPAALARAAAGRDVGGQRVRGPDVRRPLLLVRADQRRVLRSRRPVPS